MKKTVLALLLLTGCASFDEIPDDKLPQTVTAVDSDMLILKTDDIRVA